MAVSEVMDVNRDELLALVNQGGVCVSPHQLRRYITYGFISPRKRSTGRASGVRSDFAEQDVEVIREIRRLEYHPQITNLQELLFVFFARGYSVNIDVLKEYFVENFYRMVDHLQYLATLHDNDPLSYLDFANDIIESRELPNHKPGRPNKEEIAKRENTRTLEIGRYKAVALMSKELLRKEPVRPEQLIEFSQMMEVGELRTDGFDDVSEFVDLGLWEEAIRGASHDDFMEIQRILLLLRRYVDVFMEIDPESLPVFGPRLRESRKYLKGLRFIELPKVVKVLTLLLLMPDWRAKALNLLEPKDNIKKWRDMLIDLRNTLMGEERR